MAIAHCTLATRSVETTRNFLTEVFDFQPIIKPSNIPMKADWVQAGPGQEIHILEIDGFEVSPFEDEFGRHLAFTFGSEKNATIIERLKTKGVPIIDPKRPGPIRRFFCKDPNGYVFEVIENQ